MKLRCDLHINGGARKLILVAGPNENADHLALKLAAYILFWKDEPIVGASAKHPALLGQEFVPDLMALDDGGQVRLWVECGQTTINKLAKAARRFPRARIVVMKALEREAARLRGELEAEHGRPGRVEILAWPGGAFKEWLGALQEKTEAYGEGGGLSLNLVINEQPVSADLKVY